MKTVIHYTLLAILMTAVIGYCSFAVLGGIHEAFLEVARAITLRT